jgi:hypothetical protein
MFLPDKNLRFQDNLLMSGIDWCPTHTRRTSTQFQPRTLHNHIPVNHLAVCITSPILEGKEYHAYVTVSRLSYIKYDTHACICAVCREDFVTFLCNMNTPHSAECLNVGYKWTFMHLFRQLCRCSKKRWTATLAADHECTRKSKETGSRIPRMYSSSMNRCHMSQITQNAIILAGCWVLKFMLGSILLSFGCRCGVLFEIWFSHTAIRLDVIWGLVQHGQQSETTCLCSKVQRSGAISFWSAWYVHGFSFQAPAETQRCRAFAPFWALPPCCRSSAGAVSLTVQENKEYLELRSIILCVL